uniref:Transmembrane protein 134 n=1 Tax=Syphacia muris TaxID=451379 RepID=A0A0N5AL66_9BILA
MAFSGHHRSASQGQQLILERRENLEEDPNDGFPVLASPSHPVTSISSAPDTADLNNLSHNQRQYCSDPTIRDNMKVVVGSVILTILGAVLLIVGVTICLMPEETDLHGWIFLFAGFLFFIPGVYHVVYVICTVCGCPGYSLSNLPTFNK